MRKLNDNYWNRFTKIKNDKTIRNGSMFEKLVKELLNIEYGSIWVETKITHDNNRDFYLTDNNHLYWAECKNYKDSISLDNIAPTLVMAQIFDVNEILFFSYSKINKSAREKIISYCSKTKKILKIYDEILLDELIIRNQNYLSRKFKPHQGDIIRNHIKEDVQISFYFVLTPTLMKINDETDLTQINNVKKIRYNKFFELRFIIFNSSVSEHYSTEISFNNQLGLDNEYYLYVNGREETDNSYIVKKDIKPASGEVVNFLVKSNIFKSRLMLPVFDFKVIKEQKIIQQHHTDLKYVENIWLGETYLIGKNYRNIVKNFENKILNNDSISLFLLQGPSGTGKTRLLNECLEVALKNQYRILNFIGSEEDSAKVILKEILFFIFEIPRDEILKNMKSTLEKCNDNRGNIIYQLAEDIYNTVTDEDIVQIIQSKFNVVFEKLSSLKIVIFIDNIQYFGTCLTSFIKSYITYSKNQCRQNYSVFVISLNNDYAKQIDEDFFKYIQSLEKDLNFITKNIIGFEHKNNAILYLRELLQVKNDEYDEFFLKIINRFSTKPYYLYQVLYYFLEKGIIEQRQNQKGYIISKKKLYEEIDILPDALNNLIEKRWNNFLDTNTKEIDYFKEIISFVYLKRVVPKDEIKKYHFEIQDFDLLCAHFFLKKNKGDNYIFEHDLIEEFFTNYYQNIDTNFLKYIKKNKIDCFLENDPYLLLFYQLNLSNLDFLQILRIYKLSLEMDYHIKLVLPFYGKLLDRLILLDVKEKSNDWLELCYTICNIIKNKIGLEEAEQYFIKVNQNIQNNLNKFIYFPNYRDYLNVYVDLLFYRRKFSQAIKFLEDKAEILENYKTDGMDFSTDTLRMLYCMIYNRLAINYREFDTIRDKNYSIYCLDKSDYICSKINNRNLRLEMEYLNLSDRGYNYYCFFSDKEKLLDIWNKLLDYPPTILPKKAYNYFRKTMQLALINDSPQEVFSIFSNIEFIKYKDTSTPNSAIFNLSFNIYYICALIQENPVTNKYRLMEKISETLEYSKLMGGRHHSDIMQLSAIVNFYNKNIYECLIDFQEAYTTFPQSMHYQGKKHLLLMNLWFVKSTQNISFSEFAYLRQEDSIAFSNLPSINSNYICEGIIRTADKHFNLPSV